MKVRLKFDWLDYGITHNCGSVVDVSDKDGAELVAAGHEQVHQNTPSRINPDLYGLGCVPSGRTLIGEVGVELMDLPPQKFKNTHSGILKGIDPTQTIKVGIPKKEK